MTTQLRYRGRTYDKAIHEHPSSRLVEHTYRGHHFLASLLHELAPAETKVNLCYRGHAYTSHRRGPLSDQG